jgi:hypothetical protein
MSEMDLSGSKIGMESTLSIVVSNENSAEAVGYKGISVLGTPLLVGVMETAPNYYGSCCSGEVLYRH